MITYAPYQASDAHEAVELWNSAIGEEFPLDLRLWRQNVEQCPQTLQPACLIARDDESASKMVGMIVVKSPRQVSAIIVAPQYQRQGIGTELFALAEQTVGSDTTANWAAGQDYNHFFPGVPEHAHSALAFFEKLGFERGTGMSTDLWRDLTDFEIAPDVQERIERLKSDGIELCPCTERDLSALIDHLSANFPGRWVSDTINRLNVETNPSEVMIAKRSATGQVIGFAHTWSTRSRYVGPSIYWRALLGPKYGGLGPIGVGSDVRKIGLGLALLAYSIQAVKDGGATRMAIDWTELVDFYGRVGFTPWKHYISMRQR